MKHGADAPENLAEMGSRIRSLRRRLGLTQAQLAGAEMSIAYVSRIEGGERRPEQGILSTLAERLNTTVDYLLSGVDPGLADDFRLRLKYAELALESGEPDDAVETCLALQTEAQGASLDRAFLAQVSFALARGFEVQGRLLEAVTCLEGLRRDESAAGGIWPSAMVALSRCYREAGDLARAIEVAEEALAGVREAGLDGLDEATQLQVTLAAAYFERGDELHAVHLCLGAVEDADRAGSPRAKASAYWNASIMESRRGQSSSAIGLAERALALLGEGRDARNLGRLRAQLGVMMLRSDDPDIKAAERHLKRARRDLSSADGTAVDLARCDLELALARLLDEDPEAAERLATDALVAAKDASFDVAAEAHMILGQVGHRRGDRAATRRHYREAAAALTAAGADRSAAQTWYELAGLLDDAGDSPGARDAYQRAAAATGLRRSTRVPRSTSRQLLDG